MEMCRFSRFSTENYTFCFQIRQNVEIQVREHSVLPRQQRHTIGDIMREISKFSYCSLGAWAWANTTVVANFQQYICDTVQSLVRERWNTHVGPMGMHATVPDRTGRSECILYTRILIQECPWYVFSALGIYYRIRTELVNMYTARHSTESNIMKIYMYL